MPGLRLLGMLVAPACAAVLQHAAAPWPSQRQTVTRSCYQTQGLQSPGILFTVSSDSPAH